LVSFTARAPTPIDCDVVARRATTAPPAGGNIVAVSYRPNILDAFGKDWFDVREGEAPIFKPDGSGGYRLVARVQANEWEKLAAGAP
jgi:hypothetical protein